MKSQWCLTTLLLALTGCNQSPTPSVSETPTALPTLEPANPNQVLSTISPTVSSPSASSPQVSPTVTPTASNPAVSVPTASPTLSPTTSQQLSPPASKAVTISAEGIGSARVGMRLGELKTMLRGKAEFKVKSPFMVDFDAIAISQLGKDQYYILYPAGIPLSDTDVIEALVTDNPNYRTAQGVGPGTPIKQAEAVYGDATLSYNLLNESREYVKFAKQPSKAISFRTKATPGQQLAGIYPSSKAELKDTKEFHKTASIARVEVICGKNCPLPSP